MITHKKQKIVKIPLHPKWTDYIPVDSKFDEEKFFIKLYLVVPLVFTQITKKLNEDRVLLRIVKLSKKLFYIKNRID